MLSRRIRSRPKWGETAVSLNMSQCKWGAGSHLSAGGAIPTSHRRPWRRLAEALGPGVPGRRTSKQAETAALIRRVLAIPLEPCASCLPGAPRAGYTVGVASTPRKVAL